MPRGARGEGDTGVRRVSGLTDGAGGGVHPKHSGESRKDIRRRCLIRPELKKHCQKDWRGKGGTPTKWRVQRGAQWEGQWLGPGHCWW